MGSFEDRPAGSSPVEAREPVARGLSDEQAARELARHGPNALPQVRGPSAPRRLLAQLSSVFAVVLWCAAALAWLAGIVELAVAIAIVVVLNAVFAFLQEARADRAAERLRALLPSRIIVRRAGRELGVVTSEVVVGDIVCLRAGDRVPADATVTGAGGLLVDMSLVTGESEPVTRSAGSPVVAGSFVVEGAADARVDAIGAQTAIARISHLTADVPDPVTPLAHELHRTVRTIAVAALCAGACFALVSWAVGRDLSDAYVLGIGVVVALVPEGLLPTVTLALAWGAERMADRKVLVRHLEAVETLGSVTLVCTDKTGTLTQNEMTVVRVWTPEGAATCAAPGYSPDGQVACPSQAREAVVEAARSAAAASAGFAQPSGGRWIPHGDRIDVAIDVLARRLGVDVDQDRAALQAATRFAFDARRRRTSTYVDSPGGGRVFVKGAPESVLPLCTDRPGVLAAARQEAERGAADGLRVLAVASRPAVRLPEGPGDAEAGLTLEGVLSLEDPPREDAAHALQECRRAGVRVAMLTGDHPQTARSIADQVGLRGAQDPVLVGADLPQDDADLAAVFARSGVVVARLAPEDKLRVARALRAQGEVVAMTGDGVNDAPALHEADVGVAMGLSGTDVAREAADVVLLDDRFASIVGGIEQGRATYVNIRRFITYHLTDNVAELMPFVVWALTGGQFPLALGILQILAIDIGTDTVSAVALGAEPPARHLLTDPPAAGRLLNGTVLRRAFGLLGPVSATAALLTFTVCLWSHGWRYGEPVGAAVLAAASGAAFLSVVLSQAANAFACRSSTRWPGSLGWTTNRLLVAAVPISLAISLTLVLVPPVAQVLGQAAPEPLGWALALASAGALLGVDGLDKTWRARRRLERG
ncbi:cation-transporting P-type ATPase [Cellulosimicrobium cellulans]|uniref:cation-translocating P-type ATPase n=1 Tax=Cellulosimicrobium cellulans TaxID=1710 RepID=UPI001ED9C79B|nr:cation-transporting P-type ATPase [Cellulosimicrobium cellulans]UKJ64956.1 cation-transporting P-type ATPase [Cellulosimicrobium cellulans]